MTTKFDDDLYANYLSTHLLGADAGVQAFEAAADTWKDTEHEDELRSLASGIEKERQQLKKLIDDLGYTPSPVRQAVSAVAKGVGRVNPVNALRSQESSPGQLELDVLVGLVTVKRMMWETLLELSELDDRLDPAVLQDLITSADSQCERIRRINSATLRERFLAS